MENQILINHSNKKETKNKKIYIKILFFFYLTVILVIQILILIYIYRIKTYAQDIHEQFYYIKTKDTINYINQIKSIIDYVCHNIINCTIKTI